MSASCVASRSLVGTVSACLVVICGAAVLASALTDRFEHWTFEDMRRSQATRGRLAATPLEVRTARDAHRTLWSPSPGRRRVMLVDFVYTSCPTVCRALGSDFTRLQGSLSALDVQSAPSVELLSLSFDPDRDTPAQLAAYGRLHHADDRIWTIAAPLSRTATERNLGQLGVVVIRDGNGGYVHNGSIHAMTSDGKVLAIFDEGEWQAALAFAARASTVAP